MGKMLLLFFAVVAAGLVVLLLLDGKLYWAGGVTLLFLYAWALDAERRRLLKIGA